AALGAGCSRCRPRPEAAETVTRPVLLDASFLIDLERETADGEPGPAHRALEALRRRPLLVSIVTIEEIPGGADDESLATRSLQHFAIQGIHLAHERKCASLQRGSPRRLGENDAWLMATAQLLDADVVGADRTAFERLGDRYLRYR